MPEDAPSASFGTASRTLLVSVRSASFRAIFYIIARSLAWLRSSKVDLGGAGVGSGY